MSSTSVKVAVRVRPMAAKELLASSSDCITYIPGTTQIIVGGHALGSNSLGLDSASHPGPPSFSSNLYTLTQKSFTFDYVFDPCTPQSTLYQEAIAPLVNRFMEGFNATILAYGQVTFDSEISF